MQNEETRLALEEIVTSKLAATRAKSIPKQGKNSKFIKYTPTQTQGRSGTSRIIRMVELPIDPFEPPKQGFKRLPPKPPSPPPPVMHSPPRKITKDDREKWTIPPCISNWKNAKGYTIPLDKRLAADGRGLQEPEINENFAKFAESLAIAERHAREEVRQRALMQQKIAQKEKAIREENIRIQAQKARDERLLVLDDDEHVQKRDAYRRENDYNVRHEKRSKNRDLSEQIALGEKPKPTMYDARLFNTTQGMDSGFGKDSSYNIYDKPLFTGSKNPFASLYKPSETTADVNSKFDLSTRSGPVQFEREKRKRE